MTMHRNLSSRSRLACAIAALALTALTLGLALILPAKTDSNAREAASLAAVSAGVGVITLAPLEVVGVRTPDADPVARGDALAQAPAARTIGTLAPAPAKRLCLTTAGKRAHRHATVAS
jgi:hypothetical protein